MAVYKEEKTGTWRVIYRYTDWTGERKQTQKRGFKAKRDAQAWEREQHNKATSNLDMTFASFVEQYTADMKTRLKENTWATKDHIIRSKLLPYFGKLKIRYMVDCSALVIAVHDSRKSGGTAATISYAHRMNRDVREIWL